MSENLLEKSARRTTPPGGVRLIALYDGQCRFCSKSAHRLRAFVGSDRLEIRSFQTPGALGAFPGVSFDACMKRIHVVLPDGRVTEGAEAIARAVATVRWVGVLAFLYYVPLLRQLAELVYVMVARHRYRMFGRTEPCDPNGTCHLH